MSSEYPRNPIAITKVGVTPEPSNEYQELVEALRSAAERSSRIQREMAEAKSLRQEGNEEGRTDLYMWPTPEQTLEGRAAAAIAALSAVAVSETAGRVQLKLPHADDAADPSSSEVAAQPQPALRHAGDDGWQDIATAPKDGTEFLAHHPNARRYFVACFVDDGRLHNLSCNQWGEATHWRPLPTPPAGVSDNV